uniref:Mon2/Sec7/BIG1-like HDS domain-containing protein n=1 Tax=Ditylenchus dipsaci TaxID=166011 RepID=A0A915EQS2_9BILA
MERNKSLECREMIVACVTHMVQSHADKIRSGWKNVFSLFTKAASENRQTIVEAAFRTTSFIMTEISPNHFNELMDSFQEIIQCLSEFACNVSFPDTSMDAIRLIQQAAKLVSENTRLINSQLSDDEHNYNEAPREAKVWLKGWFPIIFELSCIISRSKLDVRTRSLTVMFEIVKTYGKEFNNDWWRDLFKVIFRIFDFIKLTDMGENEKNEWMTTTANHALYAIVDVFNEYYTSLAPILLPNIYQQMFWCVQQGSEQLARAAINCLENLIVANGLMFSEQMWNSTVGLLIEIFECSMLDMDVVTEMSSSPSTQQLSEVSNESKKEVENSSPSKQSAYSNGESQDSVLLSSITRCIIQMEVVDAVSNILFGRNAFKVEGPKPKISAQENENVINHMEDNQELPCMYSQLSEEQLTSLAECLMKSHSMARLYNNNHTQRTILWKAAFKGKAKPNLQKLDAHSMHCVLNILFHLYSLADTEHKALEYGSQLQHKVEYALDYYTNSHSESLRTYWLTVIQMLLNRTSGLPAKRFAALGPEYRLSLAKLILCDEQPIIRQALYKVMTRTITEEAVEPLEQDEINGFQ